MNYIRLIQSFWAKHSQDYFTGNETLLYGRLVALFNEAGEGEKWPDSMRYMDGHLCTQTGLSPNTLDKARKVLVSRGLIEFEGSGKGFRIGGNYRLIAPASSSKRSSISSSKTSSNFEELPERTSNSEEHLPQVPQQEPQEDPQQVPQQEPQNLRNSHIYKEYQTPNSQTDQTVNAGNAGERRFSVSQQSPGETPPPPIPPAPLAIPIPAGKVYGDGRVQAECLDYYAQFPDEYPRSIYVPFLRYWTSIVRKGIPENIGLEKWQTMDDWDIADRLGRWHKRDLDDQQKQQYANAKNNPGNANRTAGPRIPVPATADPAQPTRSGFNRRVTD
ncbi:helix-turn-helix domain-containing protein [Spirosoma sordidisoli]|uniref:Helix-turn-helix domain-containing protein n=1 Tax=Spirosoma sordidisoli TaxID=2502893 RepID=A0A4Q2USH6_9BACT|nr:hypothetical protein [Spirosoma sordidisoli]RYC70831.1 hypothetical protein EQG79_01385 [Spirosoma sordidisoli]